MNLNDWPINLDSLDLYELDELLAQLTDPKTKLPLDVEPFVPLLVEYATGCHKARSLRIAGETRAAMDREQELDSFFNDALPDHLKW